MTRIGSHHDGRRRYVGNAAFQEALTDIVEKQGLDPRILIFAANQKFLMHDVFKLITNQIHPSIEPHVLGVPPRACRALNQAGIHYLADILLLTIDDLKKVKGFGKQSRDQLLSILEALNRTLFVHDDIDSIRSARVILGYKYGLFSHVPVSFMYKEWPSERDTLTAMGISTLDEMCDPNSPGIKDFVWNALSYEGIMIANSYLIVLNEENQP